MKFVYSFQKILDVKTNEKKQLESVLAQAIGALNESERELTELRMKKNEVQQQLSEAARVRQMSDMRLAQQYVDFLEECIRRGMRKLVEAERKVNELQEQLVVRAVDEKVWLNAKEKAYTEFRTEMERRMQTELDEIAVVRHKLAH